MTDIEDRTPLVPRNQIDCIECGEIIQSGELKRTVQWGFWDSEAQNFEGTTTDEHYCASCWRKHFKRDKAAHYRPDTSEELWNILDAADGNLVADLRPILVGGRLWVRVVDGELQGMRTTVDADDRSDERKITFGTEPTEVTKEDFDKLITGDTELPDDEFPTVVLLKPQNETPFEGYEELPEGQQTLDSTTS